MDQSLTVVNAQIQFLDTNLALIHIPLPLYPLFVQPILKLLSLVGIEGDHSNGDIRRPWEFSFPFTNIAVTTVECSVACPRHLAREYFVPILDKLDARYKSQVSISKEDFVVMQIGGEGSEAGQRVLDLTAPLAMAGISIFFITSYTSDFILVPLKSRHDVVTALEERGFAFQNTPNGHAQMSNIASPFATHHSRANTSQSSMFDFHPAPSTPPATSIAEWQTRTFATLRRHNSTPHVDPTLTIQHCAGPKEPKDTQDRLQRYITNCLLESPHPRFISLTLTDTDSVSVTLDQDLLSQFPKSALLQTDEILRPIMLDLRNLPEESAGIVCGVAGRLTERLGRTLGGGFSMSYLSTAKAGNVIVDVQDVEEALEALREMEGGVDVRDSPTRGAVAVGD